MQTLSRPAAQALVLLSLLVSSPTFAEENPEHAAGFPRWLALSARGGYLMPGGRTDGSPDPFYLYEVYKGLFAAILEPTVRLGANLEVGPWVQLAHAQMRIRCSTDGACSGSHLRFGLQGNYHFKPEGLFNPWAGVALGYEKASFSLGGADVTYSGPEATLQAGFDRHFGGSFWAGLFVSATGGRYSTLDVDLSTGSGSESLRERTLHMWIGFGFRVRVAAPLATGPR